jgi:hypothetical protein
MKNKKEQRTKAQPKTSQKTVAESSAPESKRTIKQVVIDAITANKVITNGELIAAVKAQFPKSAFKDTHAAWYHSQARKGLLTGTPIEIPAQRQSKSGRRCMKNRVFFNLVGSNSHNMQYIVDIMNYIYYIKSIMYCIEVATCQSAR